MTDRRIPGPYPDEEMERFLASFLYDHQTFLVSEVVSIDRENKEIKARLDTTMDLPIARYQRPHERLHPAHVSGPELIQITGNMGALHAWFIHGCYWDQGWVGFGNRIYRADFKRLALLGPPLELTSTETRTRRGEDRVVVRYEFKFEQDGKVCYYGDQSAQFFRSRDFVADAPA